MTDRFRAKLPALLAVGIWAALALGVCGRVLVQPPEKGSVVPIYLAAGERWLKSDTLYPTYSGLDLYRNPPGVAVLFAPLTFLEPKIAALLWRAFSLTLYALAVRRTIRDLLPPLSAWRRCGVWVASAVIAVPAFNNGQINLLIVATAILGCAAAARGRWWEAAAWLAGCGWLKVYPFAVGLLAVVAAPGRLGWRLAVASVVLFALPFVCQSPGYVWEQHVEFIHEMQTDDRTEAEIVRAPRDWTIIPRIWSGVPVPRSVRVAVSLVAAAAFAGLVFVRKRAGWFVPGALGLIWMSLFGPATEMNTYAVVGPVAGTLIAVAGRLPRWACGCAWAGTVLVEVAVARAGFPTEGFTPMNGVPAWGAALLLAACVGWWKVAGRSAAGEKTESGTGGI